MIFGANVGVILAVLFYFINSTNVGVVASVILGANVDVMLGVVVDVIPGLTVGSNVGVSFGVMSQKMTSSRKFGERRKFPRHQKPIFPTKHQDSRSPFRQSCHETNHEDHRGPTTILLKDVYKNSRKCGYLL